MVTRRYDFRFQDLAARRILVYFLTTEQPACVFLNDKKKDNKYN